MREETWERNAKAYITDEETEIVIVVSIRFAFLKDMICYYFSFVF
jgi:hypothetical protein